ncbi:RICIN domain-containing protein [Streptomyces sp. NPDC006134]|uniref:RICIN domain-containing protein n=1 Tax=Streptomyces sp. NPDC006134 TaxID=3154467 RepID=UPI0033DE29D8
MPEPRPFEDPVPPVPPQPSVNIPTGRNVWIDHLASSLHLNSDGFHGAADGHTFLFHDRDNTNTLGEMWQFKAAGDGTYTITNAESGRELTLGGSGLNYRKVVLSGPTYPTGQKWRVQASGLFGSFSLHPADDLSVAVSPLNNSDLHLYLLPFQQYLTQFFKVVERNV